MAWETVTIKTDDGEWAASKSSTATNPLFSVPFASGISEGGVFEVGKTKYTAIKSVDFAQRGETLLVEAKESKDGKSKARGTDTSVGSDDIPSEGDA